MQDKAVIQNSMRLIKECPVCSSSYKQAKLQVIDREEDHILVHFSCPKCNSSLVAKILEMPFGVVGTAMLTDLEAEEVMKFKKGTPVNADDVLEVYQKLQSK